MKINFRTTIKTFQRYEYNVTVLEGAHPGGGNRFCYVVSDGDGFEYHSFRNGGEHFSSKINAANKAHDFVSGLVFTSNPMEPQGAFAYA